MDTRSTGLGERGSITAFVVIVAFALASLATVSFEVGSAYTAKRRTTALAQAAARAAAQPTEDQLRSGAVTFDEPGAGTAVGNYLATAGYAGTFNTSGTGGNTVVVTLQVPYRSPFGLIDTTFVATGRAEAVCGISGPATC